MRKIIPILVLLAVAAAPVAAFVCGSCDGLFCEGSERLVPHSERHQERPAGHPEQEAGQPEASPGHCDSAGDSAGAAATDDTAAPPSERPQWSLATLEAASTLCCELIASTTVGELVAIVPTPVAGSDLFGQAPNLATNIDDRGLSTSSFPVDARSVSEAKGEVRTVALYSLNRSLLL